MYKSSKTLILIVLCGLIAIAIFYGNKSHNVEAVSQDAPVTVSKTALYDSNTIANEWEWQSKDSNKSQKVTGNEQILPFTAESVHMALQAVKVDEQGNIILDHDAKIALDEALERIYKQLSSEEALALQNLIKTALPGETGEQTAELVLNYYQFLGAKDTFSSLYENNEAEYQDPNLDSINNNKLLYEELQALRVTHLGTEEAKELFRVSDAAAEFMFASMALGMDTSLKPEEISAQQSILQARQIEQAVNIDSWSSRFEAFSTQKQNIVDSSLSDEAKTAQFQLLLGEQFNKEEIEKMAYFGLTQSYE